MAQNSFDLRPIAPPGDRAFKAQMSRDHSASYTKVPLQDFAICSDFLRPTLMDKTFDCPLPNAAFSSCDLTDAHFGDSNLARARFANCNSSSIARSWLHR